MYNFSFIDFGLKDFIRTDDGEVLTKQFNSYQEADDFIADGGLDEYGWTNLNEARSNGNLKSDYSISSNV